MRVGGSHKMGYGRRTQSFSSLNEVRRKRATQQHKLREAQAARRREIAQQAIERMSNNANIFNIKADASYSSVEQTLIVAQQRAIDAAAAKQQRGLGQNGSVTA